ncbi:thiamine phosphate synthase [Sphingomicrobium clamense]|uniref:Thiamine phosphate synthase n=1 Tax=Sphingomicrobium clamense TaxID=2851013 RepID=A0ABS6V320_9SPHN|nr:thiamine phosphate synthase [Sphingomicrobium sp. B8]MBW0143950.1 thiamine phosphate synthase [Sphingomicrobium sp. B8]
MERCQTPWLMTDERLGRRLFEAIDRVPAGGGVVFRHDRTAGRERLAAQVADHCRKRGLALSVAGDEALARAVGAQMVHRPVGATDLPISLPVHDERQARIANERRAALVFVSPVYSTRSHLDAPALGPERAVELARLCEAPAIALGDMDAKKFRALPEGVFAGWAGISAFLR